MSESVFPQEKLISVCTRLTDGSHFSPKPQRVGLSIVNVKDLRDGHVDIDSCTKIKFKDFQRLDASGCTFSSGDVLFSKDGTVGKVVAYKQQQKLAALSSICIISPKNLLDQRYLGQVLLSQNVTHQIANLMSGSALRRLVLRDICALVIPVPQKNEQRAIAAILDTVDEVIRQTEALIAKLRQVKAGMLHDLLTCGLDENGELRDLIHHPELFKDSPLGRIPKKWEILPLERIANVSSGVTLGNNLQGTGAIELPYLRVANVQDGYLDLSDIKKIHINKKDIERFGLHKGDVLMNEGGDYDKLGRGTVWEGQISPCLHQNHVFRVRPNSALLDSYFLDAVSGSQYGKNYFLLSSKQSTNLASINSTQLNKFPIPCPEIKEQKAIVTIISGQEQAITSEQDVLKKLKTVKQGLMQDLLTGRVRVPEALIHNQAEAEAGTSRLFLSERVKRRMGDAQ